MVWANGQRPVRFKFELGSEFDSEFDSGWKLNSELEFKVDLGSISGDHSAGARWKRPNGGGGWPSGFRSEWIVVWDEMDLSAFYLYF